MFRETAGWSDWESLAAEDGHGPDPGSVESRDVRVGSEPLMTVGATKVQVRIDTPSGRVPAGTELTVISAPSAASDAGVAPVGATGSGVAGATGSASASRPTRLCRRPT